MSFILGGFIQTVGRLCRTFIRPLVLPVTSPSASSKSTPKYAVPNTAIKRIYDIVGTVASILILNFTTAPFILLSASASLESWRRVHYYGLWMVGGALTFFYAGGRSWLRGIQHQRVKRAHASMPTLSRTSSHDEVTALPPLDEAVREVEKKFD